ncbi:thioesterase domain-containing protein [Streptomyces sp. NPDC048254]|uniref:thioesterase domain-containing protein n=1 Tax=Streptomyces sp. NPDC048254 TaxID=3365525 RepID=UPI00372095D1
MFGHSTGALIAIEAARELSRESVPPVWAGLSGADAPGAATYLFEQARAVGSAIRPEIDAACRAVR